MISRILISLFLSTSIFAIDTSFQIEEVYETQFSSNEDPEKEENTYQIDKNQNGKISYKETRHYLKKLPLNSTCAHDYLNYRKRLLRKLYFKPITLVGATTLAIAAGASVGAAAGGIIGYNSNPATGALAGLSQTFSAVAFGAQGAVYVSTAVGATILVGYLVGTGIQIAKLRKTSKMLKLIMQAEAGKGKRLEKFVKKINRKREKLYYDPFTIEEVAEEIAQLNQTKEMCRPDFIKQFSRRQARKLARKNDLKYKVISQKKFRRYFQNLGAEEYEL